MILIKFVVELVILVTNQLAEASNF